MTYRAKMENGKVVFEGGMKPAEGAELRVDIVREPAKKPNARRRKGKTLGQRMMKFAGVAKGLPPDASINHDHYLYGTAKR